MSEKYFPEHAIDNNESTIDAIRLEVQGLNPRETEKHNSVVELCNQSFLQEYKRYVYITDEEPLSQRVIITDRDSFETFYENYTDPQLEDNPYNNTSRSGYMRVYKTGGQRLIIGYIPDIYDDVNSDGKASLTEIYGGEQFARAEANQRFEKLILLHETAHFYGNMSLPAWFQECGAYYYAREIYGKNTKNWGKCEPSSYDKYADYYQDLIKMHGKDTVDSIYFGKFPSDCDRANEIFASFNEETEAQLFGQAPAKE